MKFTRFFIIFSFGIALIGCSKNSDRDVDTTVNSSEDFALAQSLLYDAFKIVHEAAKSSQGISETTLSTAGSLFGCDSISVDTVNTPISLTVHFNGTCNERTGTITATFNGKYDALGTIVTIGLIDYSYRSYSIGSGSISSTFTNLNGLLPVYSYSFNAIQIINPSNTKMFFSGSQRISFNSGEATAATTDDNYTISGSASGSTFRGNEYKATFTEDLTLSGACNWINAGEVVVSPENKTARVLNFGSACDNTATVIVNSVEKQITIL